MVALISCVETKASHVQLSDGALRPFQGLLHESPDQGSGSIPKQVRTVKHAVLIFGVMATATTIAANEMTQRRELQAQISSDHIQTSYIQLLAAHPAGVPA